MDFSKILKEERVKANLKQAELGEKIGLSLQAISGYEQGTREPKIEVLIKLADVFDLSIDQLVGRVSPNITNNNYLMQTSDYEEQHLLQMFRGLSNEDQNKVIAITKTLHEMSKEKSSGSAKSRDKSAG